MTTGERGQIQTEERFLDQQLKAGLALAALGLLFYALPAAIGTEPVEDE